MNCVQQGVDAESREQLLAEFSDYLDTLVERASSDETTGQSPEIDLYALFTELTGIKNELRLQSRHFKSALEPLRETLSTLETSNKTISRELEYVRATALKAAHDKQRPLLLDVLDLRDRMEAGLGAARDHQPGRFRSLFSSEPVVMTAMVEGMEITLRRLDEMLAGYDVVPVPAVGKRLDPHSMRAVAVESLSDRDNGVVLQEIRRGYTRGDEILREAEVIVNRTESKE
jgi:molecular chaperone GrpE